MGQFSIELDHSVADGLDVSSENCPLLANFGSVVRDHVRILACWIMKESFATGELPESGNVAQALVVPVDM